MKRYKIVILPGDGIGPEVMESALSVLDVISRKYNFEIDLIYEVVGGKSIDEHGVPITDSVLQSCLDSDAVLLGAVGGVKWDSFPQEKKPEKGLLRLREVLGLYSNLRPAKIFKPIADASSSVKFLAYSTASQAILIIVLRFSFKFTPYRLDPNLPLM